ncbi:uncharacterized protein LOC125649209 isoform X2 [Ostrea edulis]|uniref:uncharacterized protein LOC125649209 isoform X2 n=1 Tax=Ostrea edulis TaxID=37623 RepID=UPI0024AFD57E|nr:uncharacterized protein LOC125649209 isoform X2 [Ostrea edulis]
MEVDSTCTSPSISRFSAKKRHASVDVFSAKRRKRVSTSRDADDMCKSDCSRSTSSFGKMQVSNWTLQRAEMYGLCFNSESSEISKFYELFTKKKSGFKYPLEEDRKHILDSLISQTDKIDRPGVTLKEGEKWRTWVRYRSVFEKCEKTLKSIDNELDCHKKNSKLLVLSQSALRRFYMFLKEFLIQSDRNFANEQSITGQSYIDLCCKFLEIFLLNVRSGSMEKSVMMIRGLRNLSVPDLRVTLPVATISSIGRSSSVVVIRVVEVKPDYDEKDHKEGFQITRAVTNKILGQHAGELLLDLKTSLLAEIGVIFGILCMKTSVSVSLLRCNSIPLVHVTLLRCDSIPLVHVSSVSVKLSVTKYQNLSFKETFSLQQHILFADIYLFENVLEAL